MTKNRYSYLDLVEDHRNDATENVNLFEKILTAANRAKDLQQLNTKSEFVHPNPGFSALHELAQHKITTKIVQVEVSQTDVDEEEEDDNL